MRDLFEFVVNMGKEARSAGLDKSDNPFHLGDYHACWAHGWVTENILHQKVDAIIGSHAAKGVDAVLGAVDTFLTRTRVYGGFDPITHEAVCELREAYIAYLRAQKTVAPPDAPR